MSFAYPSEEAFLAAADPPAEALTLYVNPGDVLRDSPFRNAPRVKTGIPTLDKWTEGGIPFGASVAISGAPGRGKTTLAIQIAREAREQFRATVIGAFYDEGVEGAALKLGQQAGFEYEMLRQGDETTTRQLHNYCLANELTGAFRFLHTDRELLEMIEASKVAPEGPDQYAVLIMDTIQKCRFELPENNNGERFRIEAIVGLLRESALQLPAINLMTSEVSRGAYASQDKAKRTTGLAASAEGRSIEYGVELLLVLSEGPDNTVDVEVAKNRIGRGMTGHLRLSHERARARYTEIDRDASEEAAEAVKREKAVAKWGYDEEKVKEAVSRYPGRTAGALRPLCGVRAADLSAVLEELERKGHLRKEGREWHPVEKSVEK